jgi:hypothetical protein
LRIVGRRQSLTFFEYIRSIPGVGLPSSFALRDAGTERQGKSDSVQGLRADTCVWGLVCSGSNSSGGGDSLLIAPRVVVIVELSRAYTFCVRCTSITTRLCVRLSKKSISSWRHQVVVLPIKSSGRRNNPNQPIPTRPMDSNMPPPPLHRNTRCRNNSNNNRCSPFLLLI